MPEEIIPTEEPQKEEPQETKEEVPQPVEEKKEKRWLKPLLFSILGIVLASGLVFAGYKFGQKQVQPGPQPTPTPMVVATPTPRLETQAEDRASLVVSTDKEEYGPSEIVNITIMSLREQLDGAMYIERYNERKKEWQIIEIGAFQVEEQFKDFIKSYGPAVSLEKLPKGRSLRVGWIPVTQEHLSIEGEGTFQTVALGKNRIMVRAEIDGQEEVLYSNEFIIGE